MSYTLYIDDIRNPKTQDSNTFIARSSEEAKSIVLANGLPEVIDFDHDLGGDDTAIVFIHWLVDKFIEDDTMVLPAGFAFWVHSSNPPGSTNISGWMNNLITLSDERKIL